MALLFIIVRSGTSLNSIGKGNTTGTAMLLCIDKQHARKVKFWLKKEIFYFMKKTSYESPAESGGGTTVDDEPSGWYSPECERLRDDVRAGVLDTLGNWPLKAQKKKTHKKKKSKNTLYFRFCDQRWSQHLHLKLIESQRIELILNNSKDDNQFSCNEPNKKKNKNQNPKKQYQKKKIYISKQFVVSKQWLRRFSQSKKTFK